MALSKTRIMTAQFVDIANHPRLTGHSTKEVLHDSDHYHVWVHIDEPGKQGPMHKHTADQLFYCVKGECTFRFPDGQSKPLQPGMLVTIPKGQLYQLHNTGTETLILLGSRAEAAGQPRHTAGEEVIRNVKGAYVVERS